LTTYEVWTVRIYAASFFAGLISVGLTIWQLRQLVRQAKAAATANEINKLTNLLALEDTIAERRLRLSEAGIAVDEYSKSADVDSNHFTALRLRWNEAIQMYLNALDRLCYCLNTGLLDENRLRSEYRGIVKSAITDFPDQFTLGTEFRNIAKIHESWADT